MYPEHREKTTFSINKNHFKFLGVPFGLKGASVTFQDIKNIVLTGLNDFKAFVYLHDIIIHVLNINQYSNKL